MCIRDSSKLLHVARAREPVHSASSKEQNTLEERVIEHTLNHALFKSILFLAAGAVYRLTGTRNMEELGGLARRMPLTWLAFVVGSAAIIGVPPLNGFVSEWLVFQTLFRAGFYADALRIAVLAVPGLALVGGLALACFVKVGGVVFLGTPRSSRSLTASKPGLLLDGPPLVLAAVCVFIGGRTSTG